MDGSLRVRRFEQIPSAEEFASQIESTNVPAVFSGCVKDWEAFHKWNPDNGGLDYLEKLAGSAVVEAMLSRSAPVFYGDIRRHERVPIPFKEFIGSCKQLRRQKQSEMADCSEMEIKESSEGPASFFEDARDQIYLAQVPLMNTGGDDRVQLPMLCADIQTPIFLTKDLSSINLWMNNVVSRSSSHYDPHHNLLCIVSGCKQVFLWPPSASPLLYPMPLYGEASNHSSVALKNPDFLTHPRAASLMEYADKVTLKAGDALFIPEGWYHQVDSDELTIAINFWWSSIVMSCMSEHMDAYYLRMILRRLTDKEMDKVFPGPVSDLKNPSHTKKIYIDGNSENQDDDLKTKNPNEDHLSVELDSITTDALHKLVTLVHDHVSATSETQVAPFNSFTVSTMCLQDDPVAKILWSLDPSHFQNVIISMASKFPRTLEVMITHLLTPVGAEALTRKFDEMDAQYSEDERNKFYQAFYGVFDDVNAAMDGILTLKESFARQAFNNVFDLYLGVNSDNYKPVGG